MASIIESYYYIKVGNMYYGEVGLGRSTQLYDNITSAKKFTYTSETENLVKYDVIKTMKSLTDKNLFVTAHKREAQVTYETTDMEFTGGDLLPIENIIVDTPVELSIDDFLALRDALIINESPTTADVVGTLYDGDNDVTGLGLTQTVEITGVARYSGTIDTSVLTDTQVYTDGTGSSVGLAVYYKLPVGVKDVVLTNGDGKDDYSESAQYYDETKGYVKFTKNVIKKDIGAVSYDLVLTKSTVYHLSYIINGVIETKDITIDISGITL